jgi:hypothetical protein
MQEGAEGCIFCGCRLGSAGEGCSCTRCGHTTSAALPLARKRWVERLPFVLRQIAFSLRRSSLVILRVLWGILKVLWWIVRFLTIGPINPAIGCPHCGTTGKVHVRTTTVKNGISGGKATGAILTGGTSLLFTGLSRKVAMTKMRCDHCRMSWTVS